MSKWFLNSIEINGGFLPDFSLSLPNGLTCIIGPRGSGKSTFIEALRFGIAGTSNASKSRLELVQANLGTSAMISIRTSDGENNTGYTIRRSYKQPANLLGSDGTLITTVDLDRGTFLPLDAYSSSEIEDIADESLGTKRRALLDELRGEELQQIHLSVSEHYREIEGNADQIRATRRVISDLTERIEEIGDVRAKLAGLDLPTDANDSSKLLSAAQQEQKNMREIQNVETAIQNLDGYLKALETLKEKYNAEHLQSLSIEDSANLKLMSKLQNSLTDTYKEIENNFLLIREKILKAVSTINLEIKILETNHNAQHAEYLRLEELNLSASQTVRERTGLEQRITQLEEYEKELSNSQNKLDSLLNQRQKLKSKYLLEREKISSLREKIATQLQNEVGEKIRIRVLRNADDLSYKQMLIEGLKGARVRNHEDIIESLMRLRPEQLAQIILENDFEELETLMSFGKERSQRILDAFRDNLDPLALEVVTTEDRICIELDVATGAESNFKDAAELSRGQKCTALLPLLLARRNSPLLIDQPEDNLDNHFIYETVVEALQRLKQHRQMIFVTHNANIPVLAEADLIVVLNSDGRIGFIEKCGTLDECREEIVDLLEGGTKAFELRRQRYAKK